MVFNSEFIKRLVSALALVAIGALSVIISGRFLYGVSLAFLGCLFVEWVILSRRLGWQIGLVGYVVLFTFSYCWMDIICLPLAKSIILYIAAASFSADTAAYLWGKILKGPRLAPHISPNKTWWGAVGGFLTGTSLATLVFPYNTFSFLKCLVLSGAMVMVGIAGDLAESWCKRLAGVKDSSDLIPGHGGFLDRFDSFIATVIFFYLAIKPLG